MIDYILNMEDTEVSIDGLSLSSVLTNKRSFVMANGSVPEKVI